MCFCVARCARLPALCSLPGWLAVSWTPIPAACSLLLEELHPSVSVSASSEHFVQLKAFAGCSVLCGSLL